MKNIAVCMFESSKFDNFSTRKFFDSFIAKKFRNIQKNPEKKFRNIKKVKVDFELKVISKTIFWVFLSRWYIEAIFRFCACCYYRRIAIFKKIITREVFPSFVSMSYDIFLSNRQFFLDPLWHKS